MKSVTYRIALLLASLLVQTACEMKRELLDGIKPANPDGVLADPSRSGILDLKLRLHPETGIPATKQQAEASSRVDTDDFTILILDSLGGTVRHFESYRAYQQENELLLKAGRYTVHAAWGELYEAAFDAPYFAGDTSIVIEPGVVNTIKTDCTLQNTKVQVVCNDDFLQVFKDDYSVVASNGTGVLLLDKEEQRVAYFRSGENIRLAISATTHKGLDVTSKYMIAKGIPNALYQLVLGVDIRVDSVIDQLPRPGIKVDLTMHTRDTVIQVEAPALPPDPDDGAEEPDGGAAISITGTGIGSPIEMTDGEAAGGSVKVQASIKAPAGMNKVVVRVVAPALEAILGSENPFDLINLTPTMTEILDGVGLVRPKEGATSYTLDITNLMKMLGGAGTYQFEVTVTDKAMKRLNKTLIIKIK